MIEHFESENSFRGYYITEKRLTDLSDGVIKKINMQVNAFNKTACKCEAISVANTTKYGVLYQKIISRLPFAKSTNDWEKVDFNKDVDFLYIRKPIIDRGFFSFLKSAKEKHKIKCIVIELPTYPYDKEIRLKDISYLIREKIWRKKLKKVVDYIATYSLDCSIWGIPCINIINGISMNSIALKTVQFRDKEIHIAAAASMRYWHGYDRLITGLYQYMRHPHIKSVYIHFIGDGPEIEKYRNLVNKFNLQEYCIFHGRLAGEGYEKALDQCDIAAESFGNHRRKIYLSSSLKTREYAAKGLPIIASNKIDVFDEEKCDFLWLFPDDDSPIDISYVCQKYDDFIKTHNGLEEASKEIRQFCSQNCSIEAAVFPIVHTIEKKCMEIR